MLPVLRSNGSRTAVAPWSPAHPIATIFDRFFRDDFFAPLLPAAVPSTTLPLTVWEDENNVHVEVDAPGMGEKDIDISVHQGTLVIRGERKCQRQGAGYDTRCYGAFEQHVALPAAVEADKAEARLANGVLSLTFPKSEEAKPRKIALKSS